MELTLECLTFASKELYACYKERVSLGTKKDVGTVLDCRMCLVENEL